MVFSLPLQQRLIPSLWPVIYRLATGASWPPASSDQARRFLERATQESLLPLLALEPELPPVVRDEISGFSAMLRANEARSVLIAAALRKVARSLNGEPFIVLKGCDFAFRLYEQPALRPMADVDVMVREGAMERVARALEQAGMPREFPAGPAGRSPSHHEAVFRAGNVTVEVHHLFAQRQRFRVDYAGVWDRAVPFAPSPGALRLSNADAFVYQTINMGLKYFVSPLIRYVDLWLLLHDDTDPERAASLAAEWHSVNTYYSVLRYGAALFSEFDRTDLQEPLRKIAGRSRRFFLDRFVIPKAPRGKVRVPARARQLWEKFWLMDDMARRVSFVAGHTAAVLGGRLRA